MATTILRPNGLTSNLESSISNAGVITTNGQAVDGENITLLSDSNASTGIIYGEANGVIAFELENFIVDLGQPEENFNITDVTVQCDLVEGEKTNLTLRGSTNPEATSLAGIDSVDVIGTTSNITFSSLGALTQTQVNNLRLSLASSAAEHTISEVRVIVTHGPLPAGLITLNEGLIRLSGKITMN